MAGDLDAEVRIQVPVNVSFNESAVVCRIPHEMKLPGGREGAGHDGERLVATKAHMGIDLGQIDDIARLVILDEVRSLGL